MTGLTLLNIDRDLSSQSQDPLGEIHTLIDEINGFTKQLPADSITARLMPLKMRLKQLQDAVSQFGVDGTLSINQKQSSIMELHSDLQNLANNLTKFQGGYAEFVEICMNYLLNHLTTTAAQDPRSTVIGVSNVMAQVLSKEIQLVELPSKELDINDPKYFDDFSLQYNSMLTVAGLFSAPVLGLPDIPMSALGGWAEQAINQFAIINSFIEKNFDPLRFYYIEKTANATPFDTTADILSYYIYENEFLAALIARADLLSGLTLPKNFVNLEGEITLQSIEEICKILSNAIQNNCKAIDNHIDKILALFENGQIDRNENPRNHIHLMNYVIESKIWKSISKLSDLLIYLFFDKNEYDYEINRDLRFELKSKYSGNSNVPDIDENASDLELTFVNLIDELTQLLNEMFNETLVNDLTHFIETSEFTKFRTYFQHIIHIVAAHDLLLNVKKKWTPWLLSKYSIYFKESTIPYNPYGTLELGILSIILGKRIENQYLLENGISLLEFVKPHVELQLHHLIAIEVLTRLGTFVGISYQVMVDDLTDFIKKFLTDYEVNTNSILYQKLSLYLAMLEIYKETGEYLRKGGERFVPFDPFSWIQMPKMSEVSFPYIPLNTALDNLFSG